MRGVLRGLDHSTLAMIISLVGACGLRVLWIFTVFQRFHSYQVLILCLPVSYALLFIVLFVSYLIILKKQKI